jgi:glycosyltransferase involved in cell wall biosynthesis
MNAPLQIVSTYHPTDMPWGGGNNFWRALLGQLSEQGDIIFRPLKDEPKNNPPHADIIFFNQVNSGPAENSRIYTIQDFQQIKGLYPRAKTLVRAINLRKHSRYKAKLPYFLDWADRAKDNIVKYRVNTADFVIYQSEYQKSFFEEFCGPTRNSEIIYNGAPLLFAEKGKQTPRKKLSTGQPIRFLATSFSGNPSKRLGLIASLSELPGAEVVHAGLWHKNVDKKKVKTLGTISHEEITNYMRDADYYLKLSENDICPNALIEALAYGLPIIYDVDGGGAAEVGRPYGIAFDPANMNGMLDVARQKHQALAEKIAQNRERFLITHAANAYKSVFRKISGPT